MAECRLQLGWWKGLDERCKELDIQSPCPEAAYDFSSAVEADQSKAATALMTAKADSRKEYTYYSLKTEFSREKYISDSKSRHLRRVIANFRLGSHWLKVQTGRYIKQPYDERICDTCGIGIEDEIHAIFVCPAYDSLRRKYADLFTDVHDHDLRAFLTQDAVHRIALFLTECRALHR